MPLNLLKCYNDFLEINHLNETQRTSSLKGIFNRDIKENSCFNFRKKLIHPLSEDEIGYETLFSHLTTVKVDKQTQKREFEYDRSIRLHWIHYHISDKKMDKMSVFSVQDKSAIRTYIYDIDEKYVIILEPKKDKQKYSLITAYYLKGRNYKKIINKRKRKLNEIY